MAQSESSEQSERSENGRGGDLPPGYRLATWLFLGLSLVCVLALSSVRCALGPQTHREYPSRPLLPDSQATLLPPPAMDDEYLPCSDCHEDEPTDLTVRELEDEHEDLTLAHGDNWCFDCHAVSDRDRLQLANLSTVAFDESWKLCTQCHGAKLADWRAGVHGKRMGHWRGSKEYWNCVACHDPHSPRFEPIEPKPPPQPPQPNPFARVVKEYLDDEP